MAGRVDDFNEFRAAMNERYQFIHPENDSIRGCTHILWTGKPRAPGAQLLPASRQSRYGCL